MLKTFMPEPKPVMICLFHEDHPKGKVFEKSFAEEKYDEMVEEGWVDTPAALKNQPEKEVPKVSEEQVNNMRPEDLVNMVKGLGFKVLTEEQLKAEIAKAPPTHVSTIESRIMIEELEKRGDIVVNNEPVNAENVDGVIEKMQEVFNVNPKQLNKDELVRLGKEKYGIHLMASWKEDTLISKIKEAIEESKEG